MSEKRKFDSVEADNVEDSVITLQDIIEEDQELETTADAVLGGSDHQDCTYSKGYVPRQALYACSTCATDASDRAGLCLACALECHDGHELYELYTKRNFRCDCGNSKFSGLVCKLCPNKDTLNEDNCYNQNFQGVYCTCARPYPDPDDSVEDEMVQCIACEDWFHGRHLKGEGIPAGSDYAEMICHQCMKNHTEFLWFYNWEYTAPERAEVDVISISSGDKSSNSEVKDSKVPSSDDKQEIPAEDSVVAIVTGTETGESKSENEKLFSKEAKSEEEEEKCILASLKKLYSSSSFPDHASFWPDGWRKKLCSCVECCKLMKEKKVSFLLEIDDTVAEYERKGTAECKGSSLDRGMQALGGMNRIQQVEVIQGYNDMKDKLSEYLKKFADEGKVVTKEDIKSFFQQMTQNKRQRVTIPHFCK